MNKILPLLAMTVLAGCTTSTSLSDVTSQEKGPKRCYDPKPALICETRGEHVYCSCYRIQNRTDGMANPIDDY
jgi:hypothetical protein